MEKTRKLLSIILCLALTLCLALPALAAEDKYTLTIKSKTPNHDYEAYQIFAGELAKDPETGKDTLVNLTWGNGVQDETALLTAIQEITVNSDKPFESCQNVDDVANKLAEFKDNAAELDAFAAVVAAGHLSDTKYTAPTGNDKNKDGVYIAQIANLPAGYYLVKEADFIENEGDNNAYTKFILEIVQNAEVYAKADVPTLEKKVSNTDVGPWEDAAAASIGSKVYFKITSKVPEMDGYNKYFFIVNDTLSEGLTVENGVKIKIGETQLQQDSDFLATTTGGGDNNPTTLTIIFNDFIRYKTSPGAVIEIIYSATVNKYAEIGTTGNLNTANLQYSNNPNFEYQGGNEPNSGEPTGVTPDDITAVYVTAIRINKVDTSGYPLIGAGFTLSGQGVITTGVTTTGAFNPDLAGGYYELNNGAYTNIKPTDQTKHLYKNTDTTYSPSQPTTTWESCVNNITQEKMVGKDGVLKFEGLGEGTYTIKETKAPENYNKIDEDITVKITWKLEEPITDGAEKCTWSATYQIGTGREVTVKMDDSGIIPLTIQNRSGAELPSTGGIGTTIFVYGGIILMVLALGVVAVRTYSRKKNA